MYFDEVARRGAIRRASDHLDIGAPLFKRTTKALS
ncbi:DNA-binding transcriptional LysR family regulator [Sphingobium boeckii]|uniref:DNA-binding transcriptional LysR family regulator n=1 Tax=Sphingobium boeckii TaxID=1082345 RepID=A0A7W9AGH7_9SPHN|nr:DNA-binding transcriptional LysR family regulator [Sphingobium boeckii]